MKHCFNDIHTFGNGYERPKGYSKVDFDVPGTPVVNEVKSSKEPGPCFKCGGPHFLNRCMKNKGHSNNKFQNYRKTNDFHKFYESNCYTGKFPTYTISSQHHSKLSFLRGISAEYPITAQNCTTTTLFDTGANMFVISQKIFYSLLQKQKLLKSNIYVCSNISQWH